MKDAVARSSSYERRDKRDTRDTAEKAEKGNYGGYVLNFISFHIGFKSKHDVQKSGHKLILCDMKERRWQVFSSVLKWAKLLSLKDKIRGTFHRLEEYYL